MPTFYQPLQLVNDLASEGVEYRYSYEGTTPLKCLKSDCSDLPAQSSFRTVTTANPQVSGCWAPSVANQTELNANYARVRSADFQTFIFFKQDGSDWVLNECSDLSNAYSDGTPVVVLDQDGKKVTIANYGRATLQVQPSADGPVILVGILDIGEPEGRRTT